MKHAAMREKRGEGRMRIEPVCAVVCATLLASLFMSLHARAACTCQCVDGQIQPLCGSAIDLPPICPPALCGPAAPSIAPINPPTVAPLGTSACRQARLCDQFGNCRWQQVCG
jgi:hypothetical protein